MPQLHSAHEITFLHSALLSPVPFCMVYGILQCSFAVLCGCSFIDHSCFLRLICFPEQLPSLLNHDRALLKIRVGDVFIRFEKSLHLSLSSDHRLCWRNKPEGLFVWHLAFLMSSACLTPEPYEIGDDFLFWLPLLLLLLFLIYFLW